MGKYLDIASRRPPAMVEHPATPIGVNGHRAHPSTPSPTCPECRSTDLWCRGPVVICKSCRHEWTIPCVCGANSWTLRQNQWQCLSCQAAAPPAKDDPHLPCPVCGDRQRWPSTRGPVCPTCFVANLGAQKAEPQEPAPQQTIPIRWGSAKGWIAITDPTTGKTYEIPAKGSPAWVIEAARRHRQQRRLGAGGGASPEEPYESASPIVPEDMEGGDEHEGYADEE